MARDFFFTKDGRQAGGNALGQLTRVDEDQRGAMFVDEPGDLPVNLIPLLMRADGVSGEGGTIIATSILR